MLNVEMKSSNASEAIAALCGFARHAAYLEFSRNLKAPYIFDIDFARLEDRMLRLGYSQEEAEWLIEQWPSLEWPRRTWKAFGSSENSQRDTWFYHCESVKVPFIVINKARRYWMVEWDHISAGKEYDALARSAYNSELQHRLLRAFHLIVPETEHRAMFEGSA